jgi:O-antigen ligase
MEALAIIAGILLLLWWAVYALRGSLIHGCLAFLAVALCFGYNFFKFEVGPISMTLDRVVLLGLIVVYVVQRRLGLTDPKPVTWPDVVMLLLGVVLALSKFSHSFEADATGKVVLWQLIAGFLLPMVVYWIARQSPIDERAIVTTYVVLAIVGVYLAVTALAEVTQQWWLVFPSYIADPKVGIHFGRARGPMVGSQTMGLYLDVCLLCLWMARRHLGRMGSLGVIILVPLFLAAIYVTYTRCVWISIGLCGLVVLGLPMSGRRRAAFVGSALAAAAVLVAVQWESLIHMEREEGAAVAELSAKSRVSFAYVSWNMFLDAPLLGVGYGRFPQAATPYLSDRSTSLNLEDIRHEPNHNTFLAMLTETGLIGFGLFMAMLAGWAIKSWQLWRNTAAPDWVRQQGLMMLGMLVIYFGPALFVDLRFSPEAQYLTFLLAGLTIGLAASPLASPAIHAEQPSLSAGALI